MENINSSVTVKSQEQFYAIVPESEKDYPHISEQMKNASIAAVSFVNDLIKGAPLFVEEKEVSRRLEICKGCEWFDHEQTRCKKCGCNMNLKTRLESAHCPLDPPKW